KALARGIHTHRLLQALPALPPATRIEAARRYLHGARELDDSEREEIIAQVQRLLDDARFADLFRPGSRAEVPIVGRISRGGGTCRIPVSADRWVRTARPSLMAD